MADTSYNWISLIYHIIWRILLLLILSSTHFKRNTFSCIGIVLLMCIIYTTAAGWTKVESPTIPETKGDSRMVAYNENNNLIYLLGGAPLANTYRAITFNVSDKSYVYHGQLFTCKFYDYDAQNYVQKGNVLYYVRSYTDNTNNLFSYTLSDPPLNQTECQIVGTMDHISSTAQEGCLATVDKYLLYTWQKGLYIYNIDSNTWTNLPITPNTHISRISHSCQVTNNKYLYIFGGTDTADDSRTDTIEKINVADISNINNELWTLLNQTLPGATAHASSVIFHALDIIYYIGGQFDNPLFKSGTVATINTETDMVRSLENGQLSEGLSGVSSVLVSNIIYAFGGQPFTSGSVSYYQYLTIETYNPTLSPTMGPTTSSPTMFPTETTSSPTSSPTTTAASNTSPLTSSLMIIIIAVSVGVVLIVCIVVIIIYNRKKKNWQTNGSQISPQKLEMVEANNLDENTTNNTQLNQGNNLNSTQKVEPKNVEANYKINVGTDMKPGHDPATGLAMKAIMYKQIINICNENELNVAVCSADMDGMKGLNDTLGHHITDNIIKFIAKIMMHHSKESKNISVFRMNAGGDEFAMIFRDTDNESIVQWADDLRQEIDNSTKASISIGIAMRKNKEMKNQWFNRAEKALMQAKKNGKNTVVLDELE